MTDIVLLSSYQPANIKTVAISGCFDILHIGHIRFIASARSKGERLVVLLESDEFIQKYKMRQPFQTQKERAEILSHIKEVDQIVLLPLMGVEMSYEAMWKKVRPNIIAVTNGDTYLKEKKAQAAEIGAEVVEVTPLINGRSTTIALTLNPDKAVVD